LAPFRDYGAKLRPIIAAMEERQRKIGAPPLNFVLGSSPDFTSRAATDPPVRHTTSVHRAALLTLAN
jgi:hypothetical protein